MYPFRVPSPASATRALRYLALIALASALPYPGGEARAATYVVTSTTGSMGECTGTTCTGLLAAVHAANQTPEDDTIVFAPGVSGTIALSASVQVVADGGWLGIDGDSDGDGLPDITLDKGEHHSVVWVRSSARVRLANIHLTRGSSGAGGGINTEWSSEIELSNCSITHSRAADGAGIFLQESATMRISRCTISDNWGAVYGAGILSHGNLTIEQSTISGNREGTGGWGDDVVPLNAGAIYTTGNLKLVHSTVVGNVGGALRARGSQVEVLGSILTMPGEGAACFRWSGSNIPLSTIDIRHSLVLSGLAQCANGVNENNIEADPALGPLKDNRGASFTHMPALDSPVVDAVECDAFPEYDMSTDQRGVPRPQDLRCDLGAVETTGDLVVTTEADVVAEDGECSLREAIANANANARIHEDCAAGYGDDLISFAPHVQQAAVDGGQLVLGNDSGDAGLTIIDGYRPGQPNVVIDGTSQSRIFLAGHDAATPAQVRLSRLRIVNGNDVAGGALYVWNAATVALNDCAFDGNQADDAGGAIENKGELRIERCTFASNTAHNPGVTHGGGAIFNNGGTLTLLRSTLHDNTAVRGAGILNLGGAELRVEHSTFSANLAVENGGGVLVNNSEAALYHSTFLGNGANGVGGAAVHAQNASVTLGASVLAASAGGANDCFHSASSFAAQATLVQDGTCITAGVDGNLDGDPLLDPLDDNGGPTPTHLPQLGSPLLDGVACDALPGFLNGPDQREVARPQGMACDIGAVEYNDAQGHFRVLTLDAGPGGGCTDVPGILWRQDCDTLEAAIDAANAWPGGPSLIDFVPSLAGDIPLSDGLVIAVGKEVAIRGNEGNDGQPAIALRGGRLTKAYFRPLSISAQADVTIDWLGIVEGISSMPGGGLLVDTGARVRMSHCRFADNIADNARGGAVTNLGALTLSHCRFQDNGSDIFVTGLGGAIHNQEGTLTLEHSVLTGNVGASGGALSAENGQTTVRDSVFTGNASFSGSGGALSLSGGSTMVSNSRMEANTAATNGGAVVLGQGGGLNLDDSTLEGNTAGGSGGAIYTYGSNLVARRCTLHGNTAPSGGAIRNAIAGGGQTELWHCTVSGNQAAYGGAVWNSARFFAVQSTLSGNVAAERGGALYNSYSTNGAVTFVHSTVTGNQAHAAEDAGAGIYHDSEALFFYASVLAGNTGAGGDCRRWPSPARPFHAEHSVVGAPGNCPFSGTGNQSGVDPLLGPLQDNGGPTLTHLPAADSPLRDAVDCDVYAHDYDNSVDQRGVRRPFGARCDIGSVEVSMPQIFMDGFEASTP